jgi:hypothetical protein
VTIGHWVVKWYGRVLTEQAIVELMEVLKGKG